MKQFLSFTLIYIKLLFRSKEAVLWNLAFPLFMFVLYVTLFSGIYPEQISTGRAVSDNLAKESLRLADTKFGIPTRLVSRGA